MILSTQESRFPSLYSHKSPSVTNLPIVAGFGIKNTNDVKNICKFADGVVVGSSIINIIKDNIKDKNKMINEINFFTRDLKKGTE